MWNQIIAVKISFRSRSQVFKWRSPGQRSHTYRLCVYLSLSHSSDWWKLNNREWILWTNTHLCLYTWGPSASLCIKDVLKLLHLNEVSPQHNFTRQHAAVSSNMQTRRWWNNTLLWLCCLSCNCRDQRWIICLFRFYNPVCDFNKCLINLLTHCVQLLFFFRVNHRLQ